MNTVQQFERLGAAQRHNRYPRLSDAVGEYNGKFMSGQFVLRGGSYVTAPAIFDRIIGTSSPRDARWQFLGLRLTEDM
jgi:formylglycine-generating enzyme required for sulfatase activity